MEGHSFNHLLYILLTLDSSSIIRTAMKKILIKPYLLTQLMTVIYSLVIFNILHFLSAAPVLVR